MEKILSYLQDKCDYADIRHQIVESCFVEARDREIKNLGNIFSEGYGIRVLINGCWGFACVSDDSLIKEAAAQALRLARSSAKINNVFFQMRSYNGIKSKSNDNLQGDVFSLEEKAKFTKKIDEICYISNKIKSTSTLYKDTRIKELFYNTEGCIIETISENASIRTMIKARSGNIIQETVDGFANTGNFKTVIDSKIENIIPSAAERVLRLLDAKPAPKGIYKAILDPELVGVFVHEAIGHAAEADHILAGTSILKDYFGREIGARIINIVDDPTIDGYGYYKYDSEGIKSKRVDIIKNGVVSEYLHNRETSSRMNLDSNGHGRAASFASPPIVRMSNTYMQKGDSDFQEMLDEIKNGVYLCGELGGVVNPSSGEFLFKCKEGFIIENSEITHSLRDVSLTGHIAETLHKVVLIGNDLRILHKPGGCGKYDQIIPVDLGGPHILVDEVRVGGTE